MSGLSYGAIEVVAIGRAEKGPLNNVAIRRDFLRGMKELLKESFSKWWFLEEPSVKENDILLLTNGSDGFKCSITHHGIKVTIDNMSPEALRILCHTLVCYEYQFKHHHKGFVEFELTCHTVDEAKTMIQEGKAHNIGMIALSLYSEDHITVVDRTDLLKEIVQNL